MKKILTVILTLVLLLGICVFLATATATGSLSMTDTEGKQGDTVSVSVNLDSNPGLITMKFAVSYPDELELVKVEDESLLKGWNTPAPDISSPYTVRWADALANTDNTATGKMVTLTFKIKESATPGNKTISVMFKESWSAEGIKNIFENVSATVTVKCKTHSYKDGVCVACGQSEYKIGDIDCNREINTEDVVALLLYISMPDMFPIGDVTADFTGDGAVTTEDAVRLLLHISMPDQFPL